VQGLDTETIDLSQVWVLPGLMDAHTHLTLNFQLIGAGMEGVYLKESTAMRALHGLHTAKNVLHVGFTTVRDVGNDGNYAAGIPPADSLRAMTVEAAQFLGVEKTRGAIAKGLAADIIATPENPLDNLQALRKVMFVMKNGKVLRYDRCPCP